jgi:hypothetical protein
VPCFIAAAHGCGKRLANAISASQATEICTVSGTCTRNKKTHGLRGSLLLRGLLRKRDVSA